MSDGEALLRAILDAPDDDALRLIYADYLDEHGQPERAEFIRVQCEIARRTELDGRALGILDELPEVKELRRREWELWDVATRFAIDTTSIWPIQVRRGFIHSVTCTAADWLAHADAIVAAHPVREVRLTTRTHPMAEMGEIWGQFVPNAQERTYTNLRWPGITFHLPESTTANRLVEGYVRGLVPMNEVRRHLQLPPV